MASVGRQGPGRERAILTDVPYLGVAWEENLDGPQDFSFPSAMRAVMYYLGEPAALDYRFYLAACGMAYQQTFEPDAWYTPFDQPWAHAPDPARPVDRAFAAAGYDYETLVNAERPDGRGSPPDAFGTVVAPDEVRAGICASIDRGVPAIVWGSWPGAAVVTGYDDRGETLIGWWLDFDGTYEKDDSGYLRLEGAMAPVQAAILVGEKRERPPLEDSYRAILLDLVNAARTPELHGRTAGLETFRAWARAVETGEGLPIGDADAMRKAHESHFTLGLTIAEGRAFGGEMLSRIAKYEPDVEKDLWAAANCHWTMHDLSWRLWAVVGGIGDGQAQADAFGDPAVRAEARDIIEQYRILDTKAVALVERALLALGTPPESIAQPLPWERELADAAFAAEAASGGDAEQVEPDDVGWSLAGVPGLAWRQGKECSLAGALEAALAPTRRPASYTDIIGYSGLAFATPWPWNASAPCSEACDLASLGKAIGWRLGATDVATPPGPHDRNRIITNIVLSTRSYLPVVSMFQGEWVTIRGYQIHSMDLYLREYGRPADELLRVSSAGDEVHGPFLFLNGLEEPLPAGEALRAALEAAGKADPRALEAWRGDLARYGDLGSPERERLFDSNWPALATLGDARAAVSAFLREHADALPNSGDALRRAADAYAEEARLVAEFLAANGGFVERWGGTKRADEWEATTRSRQSELLAAAHDLEETAREALGEALRVGG